MNVDHDLRADGSPAAYRRPDEAELFGDYAAIIRRLRAPDGCPWDRKQTLRSLRRYIVEESFETLAAIEDLGVNRDSDGSLHGAENGDVAHADAGPDTAPSHELSRTVESEAGWRHVAEEIGDVLLVTLLLADALEQESGIRLSDILGENGRKLVRRHPHVFADVSVSHADEVAANWDQIKREQEGRSSAVHSVSGGLPPLERAYEIQKKAASQGFDWPDWEPVIAKIREETDELEAEIARALQSQATKADRHIESGAALELSTQHEASQKDLLKDNSRVEHELGDLLFSVVNLSRKLKADPSVALSHTNRRFLRRFRYIEDRLAERNRAPEECGLEELDRLWDEAKAHEQDHAPGS